MNFFEQQDAARRRTGWLVAAFVAAVALIIVVIYLVVVWLFFATGGKVELWNPELFLGVSAVVLLVVLVSSLYKMRELSRGGEAVALLLGGRRLDPATREISERRLLNVVEEMSIASGIPVPPVFVLDREAGINAFAAGFGPGDAVIGVTRGTLQLLNRDELQGVMAHEFSHILNGDMRLNLRLIGILHGILVIAIIGYYLLRTSGGSRRTTSSGKRDSGGGQIVLLALALLVIGWIGVLFGKLIKAAVSRQREYLADAAAVQFTRNPDGIAGALKKIGGISQQSRIEDAHAEEASHMFFGDAMVGSFFNLLSTHPPLADRVKRIDPSFDGKFPRVARQEPAAETKPKDQRRADAARRMVLGGVLGGVPGAVLGGTSAAGLPGVHGGAANLAAAGGQGFDPRMAVQSIAAGGAAHLAYAGEVLARLPEPLREAAHDPYSARAIVYALLLDDEPTVRGRQFQLLQQRAEPASFTETKRLAELVAALEPEARVPLVEMCFPALRSLSLPQYQQLRAILEALVQADQRIDEWEYILRTMLTRHLDVNFGLARPPRVRYRALSDVVDAAAVVLSVLARVGHGDEQATARAFAAGWQHLGVDPPIVPRERCTLPALDQALARLAESAPPLKQQILTAAAACVAADGQATVRERDLLRAVSDALGAPMPPILTEPIAAQAVEP
jgi:Zn-dependent protease with chaperone function